MILTLNTKQQELLNKIGFDFEIDSELTDEQLNTIDESITDYFQTHGIDNYDSINEIGKICESIIDLLNDQED